MGIFDKIFGKGAAEEFKAPSKDEASAITLLGIAGDFDGLAKILRSRNPHVRAKVAVAASLGGKTRGTGDGHFHYSNQTAFHPRALDLLATMLKDRDEGVRDAAADVLNGLEDPSAERLLADYRGGTSQ